MIRAWRHDEIPVGLVVRMAGQTEQHLIVERWQDANGDACARISRLWDVVPITVDALFASWEVRMSRDPEVWSPCGVVIP